MASGILQVLLFCGCWLLFMLPIPMGAFTAYHARYEFDLPWSWSVVAGVAIAVALALVGLIFLGLGNFIVKRRIKRFGYHDIENDA